MESLRQQLTRKDYQVAMAMMRVMVIVMVMVMVMIVDSDGDHSGGDQVELQ